MNNKKYFYTKLVFTRKDAEFLFNLLRDFRDNNFEICLDCSYEHARERCFPICKNCNNHIPHGVESLDDELREFLFPTTNDDPLDDDLPF